MHLFDSTQRNIEKVSTSNQICLVSLTAAHYRKCIYTLMDREIGCDFIFGKESPNVDVKQMDLALLCHTHIVPNIPVGRTPFYRMPGVVRLTRGYKVVIDDMGIFCLTSWQLLFAAKLRGQRVYIWSHGWYGREGFVKKWIKRAYSALSDGMLVYGNYARDLMIRNGFNPKKLHVIHNSLDYDEQLRIRRQSCPTDVYTSHFGNQHPTLLFIGRLTQVKRLDLIIEAVARLKYVGETYNLVLVGDGEVRSDLQQMVEEKQLTHQVWFYGACYDEQTNAQLVYNADLCVAPGNIGLTAMHAMMFGCPCMSHNNYPFQMPEFEAIREGTTGTFFEQDNAESLAETTSAWFAAHPACDRNAVREACFKEIDEQWNPHRQVEIIKSVISQNEQHN